MTEDDEEKRFSRKKSAIKGPFIQDESGAPKSQKPAENEDKKPIEEPVAPLEKTVPAGETEDNSEKKATSADIEEKKVDHRKPVTAEPEPAPEDRKTRKKKEKEDKKAQAVTKRESRKKEKISRAEARKVNSRNEESQPAKVETKAETAEPTGKEHAAKPAETGVPAAVAPVPPADGSSSAVNDDVVKQTESSEPESPVNAEAPEEAAGSKEEESPASEEEIFASGITETQRESSGEETVESETGEREERRFKKGVPMFSEPAEEPAQVESKKEKRKKEKEEKRKKTLIERESRKKEVKPKIRTLKKGPLQDVKKLSEPGMLAKREEEAPSEPPAENEEDNENNEAERVSRFSLKKFVTAYRDRQSVLVRQAEIKRFQSALFPRVMARKWQTSITPSVELPSQAIELPPVPLHMKLGLFFFRNFYSKRQNNEKLETALRKAKMPYSAIQYYSMITVVAILSILVGLIGISVFSLVTGMFLWYAYPALGGFVGLGALVSLNSPQSLVNKRKKDIDSKLPMALAYIATMASADVPVETIMHELGKSYEYGEIAKEARAISASSRLFGNDIVTALREESKYSPSLKFSEFLQGITSTVTSGGNLKDYFTIKAVQFQSELSTVIRANAESVGVLAESYVTVGVAFPLMLLVILGVMAALSPSGGGGLTLVLYLVVLAIIPAITFGFTFLVSSTVKEVDV